MRRSGYFATSRRTFSLEVSPFSDTVSSTKTTIDITDALLESAKQVAHRDRTTLRELVQEGLRKLLAERQSAPSGFRLRNFPLGSGGFQPEFADGNWQDLRDDTYRGRGA